MKIYSFLATTLCVIFLLTVFAFGQIKPIRVACIGNSITYGSGETSDKSYPVQLGKLLGANYQVRNYGISARTLLRKGDFPYWKEQFFIEAKEFEPQIIIIKLGTNDTKPQNWVYHDEFYKDYVDFINEFKKSAVKPQIFICYPCPVFISNWGIRDSMVRLEIPIIDSIRKFTHTDLMDFNTPLLDSSALFPDGVHPSAKGYLVLAQIAKSAILDSSSGIIRTFNSNKLTFDKDEAATLYWDVSPGSEVTLNGTAVSESDSLTIHPNQTTMYVLISKGKTHSDTMNVVLRYLQPGKIKSFYAKPRMLEFGANDTSRIYWTTSFGSQVFFDDGSVEMNGIKEVSPSSTTSYKLNTIGDTTEQKEILIQVLPSEEINRSLDGIVKSSTAAKNFDASNAIDGDSATSWKSRNESSPWIYVDFEKIIEFKRVILTWGNNYAKSYRLQAISETGSITTIYTQSSGKGGKEEVAGLSGSGRYLRLLCSSKLIADSGYVLNEFEIYGQKKITSVREAKIGEYQFQLHQNYPNPFNPQTVISYTIGDKSFVTLKVFDLLGNEVITLVNESKEAGNYKIGFNFKNNSRLNFPNGNSSESPLASGVYFYQLLTSSKAGSTIQTKKMMLIK